MTDHVDPRDPIAGAVAQPGDATNVVAGPDTTELRKVAIRSGGFNIVSQAILFVVRTGGTIVLGRLLHPEAFGLIAMVTVFYMTLANFGENGFTEYIIQKKDISGVEISNIFWLHAAIGIFMTVGLIVAAPVVARFYNEPAVTPVLRVLSTAILGQVLATYPLAVLRRRMEFLKIAIAVLVVGVLGVALAILGAILGLGYWAVVIRQLSDMVLIALAVWAICPVRIHLPNREYNVLPALKYAVTVYGNYVVTFLARNLDKAALGKYFGPKVLGFYDRAYHLSAMPVAQIATPLESVGLATLSRLRDEPRRYVAYYTKAVTTLSLIGVYLSILVAAIGGDAIVLLLGGQWSPAGPIVRAFSPGIAGLILFSTAGWLNLSLGQPQRWLRWTLATSMLRIILMLVAVRFGPSVVAAVLSVSYLALVAPSIWYGGKPIHMRAAPIVKRITPFFVAGLLAAGLWFAFDLWFPPTAGVLRNLEPIYRILIGVPATAAAYFVLVLLLHRSLAPIRDLLSIVRVFLTRYRPEAD